MKPSSINRQAARVLDTLESCTHITQDPAELALVLRTASEACAQVNAHNVSARMLQYHLGGRDRK